MQLPDFATQLRSRGDPVIDYVTGGGTVWDAALGYAGPETLEPGLQLLARAAGQTALLDLAWSAKDQLSQEPLFRRWANNEYITPEDIAETHIRQNELLLHIAEYDERRPGPMVSHYYATLVIQGLLARRGDRDHLALAGDPRGYYQLASYDPTRTRKFYKLPLLLTAPGSRVLRFTPDSDSTGFQLWYDGVLARLPDPPSADIQESKPARQRFATRRTGELILAGSDSTKTDTLSAQERDFLDMKAAYFIEKADEHAK